ncbi:hypothetical protein [Vitreimonas flagellata]|nr:hypothetical protein [Vitreimonas flagellata]
MHPQAAQAAAASFDTAAKPAVAKFYALLFAFMAAAPFAMSTLNQIA